MQLSQFEKLVKLSNNKFFVRDYKSQITYVITIQPFSQYNRVLLQLDHPYLLTVTDAWEERGQACSLQRCDALSDLQEVSQNNRLTENLILQILLQISEAMEYMQIHRCEATLTLKNVFLDKNSQVKIDVLNISTKELEYVSPEVLRKEQEAAGIWSLACIAYYLTMQKMPFIADNEQKLAYNIIYKEPIPADFTDFPLVGAIVKAIFTKNIKKRIDFKQLCQFLANKVTTFDLQDSIRIGTYNRATVEFSKKQSVYSMDLKESQIDMVEQSVSLKNNVLDTNEKPAIPQIITLDMFEDQLSGYMKRIKSKNRPQTSTINPLEKDVQKELFNKLQRMRPNSAIAFSSGKEFIARNIKQEIQNRRLMSSTSQLPIALPKTLKAHEQAKRSQNEISIDLKDANKLKNGDLIRVYNLEYHDEKKIISKNAKIHMKILQPRSPKVNPKCPQKLVDNLQVWKQKMMQQMDK